MVGGGSSDDPESDETPECESDLDKISPCSFEFSRGIFLRLAGACPSESSFPDGFPRLTSDFPGMERDFDWSEGRSDFAEGGVSGRLRTEKSPRGKKCIDEARLQSFSPWSARSDSGVGHGRG